MGRGISEPTSLLHHRWAIITSIIVASGMEVAQCENQKAASIGKGTMKRYPIKKTKRSVAFIAALIVALGGAFGFAVAKDNVVQSNANFYAQTSDGECGLEFTIVQRNRTIKGSLAFTDAGLHFRLSVRGFVAVNGKLSESPSAIFDAMVARKGLGVGFYDGTILPIDLVGLDPKPFADCVQYSLGLVAQ